MSDKLSPRERELRHRRLAEIFGDGPPTQTRDDLDDPTDRTSSERSDEWLLRQVPPHHVG